MNNSFSWGQYPKLKQKIFNINWQSDTLPTQSLLLPYGSGLSYGDSCQIENGLLLSTKNLNRFIAFDKQAGTITCEAGVLLKQILAITVPAGWFLPVLPGTQYVTLGGAIANDIHGKNHATHGSFGNYVEAVT